MSSTRCYACRDTGWLHYRREVAGYPKPLDWSAACRCPLGHNLASGRERPAGDKSGGGRPVRVEQATESLYAERMAEGRREARELAQAIADRGRLAPASAA